MGGDALDLSTVGTTTETGGAENLETTDITLTETGETGGEQPPVDTTVVEGETPPDDKGKEKTEDLSEYEGSVLARMNGLAKKSPALGALLKSDPAVRNDIAAAFRREMAYRELYPTVAEAREMRETFPNGMRDVQALMQDKEDADALDNMFFEPQNHEKLVEHLWGLDRDATTKLLESLPKHWARLAPESYNATFSKIIGQTLGNDGIPAFLDDLINLAKGIEGGEELVRHLGSLARWTATFAPKAERRLSPEEEKFQREKQEFEGRKAEQLKADTKVFHNNFLTDSKKLQTNLIGQHRLIKGLPASIKPEQKARIVELVRQRVISHLDKSASFMGRMKTAYRNMDTKALQTIQQEAWSQAWLLNRYVRAVLNQETPNLTARKPGANATPTKTSTAPAAKTAGNEQKGPRQIAGIWYKADGTRFSTEDILRGKHLET